jgi:hypothetical protein
MPLAGLHARTKSLQVVGARRAEFGAAARRIDEVPTYFRELTNMG